jgi:hypothetical protein
VLVPLDGQNAAERKGIEWLREEYNVLHGRFSPDMRHIAYITDQEENGKLQLYVRPFDAAKPESPPAGAVVQISADASGMIGWRQDGREMYFLQPDPKNTDVHSCSRCRAGGGKQLAVGEREQRRAAFRVRRQRSLADALRLEDAGSQLTSVMVSIISTPGF